MKDAIRNHAFVKVACTTSSTASRSRRMPADHRRDPLAVRVDHLPQGGLVARCRVARPRRPGRPVRAPRGRRPAAGGVGLGRGRRRASDGSSAGRSRVLLDAPGPSGFPPALGSGGRGVGAQRASNRVRRCSVAGLDDVPEVAGDPVVAALEPVDAGPAPGPGQGLDAVPRASPRPRRRPRAGSARPRRAGRSGPGSIALSRSAASAAVTPFSSSRRPDAVRDAVLR